MRYPDGGGLTAVERARRERVRFQAAEVWVAGMKPPQVARVLRVSRESVYAWWEAAWTPCVPEGSREWRRGWSRAGGPGRPGPLEQGPAVHGRAEDQRWTLARVSLLVARRFHVRFSRPQLSRILRQMGFSVQVRVRCAAQRDEEQMRLWRIETWARVE
ncbi:winged helix-turn-helix domain-containing protein [Streptomyces sp. NBC_01614]|uniref:Winged helix-turn-helix domain-containing protein n=1 Tax=Streptomyces sp. NBC_00180 TaxID=2903632 RepID=A0AAU1ID73_9ACTN